MRRDQATINEVLRRSRDRPLIGVFVPHLPEAATQRLFDRFSEREWQAVHLGPFSGRLPRNTRLAGALLANLPTDDVVRQLLAQGLPCVRLGSQPHPDDHLMPAVVADFAAEGRIAAEHYQERGFKHVGFVGRKLWHTAEMMYEGFRERAERLGMECHLLSLDEERLKAECPPDLTYVDMQRLTFQSWLQRSSRPLGLLTSGDPEGNRYCHWAIEAGLRVPEDVAILTVGNNPMICQAALVPLSAIERDHARMIDLSIDRLRSLLCGEQLEAASIAIPPRGVVNRRSTDVLAATDPRVVEALQFMWDHITEDLSVDQIAEHVGVTRRTLARGFQRELGRGVNAEFQRRRLEKACELLRETELEIGHIAQNLSFSSASRFSRVFRATYGQTPAQYRAHQQ